MDLREFSAGPALDEMIAVAESAEETLVRAEGRLAETYAVLAAAAAVRERRKPGVTTNACPGVPHC